MIYLFLAPGFEEVEALFPLDILRRAGLEVATVGIGGRRVPGAHGVVVEADLSVCQAVCRERGIWMNRRSWTRH